MKRYLAVLNAEEDLLFTVEVVWNWHICLLGWYYQSARRELSFYLGPLVLVFNLWPKG
jgi:hypothetical protein